MSTSRILIVDDEIIIARELETRLRGMGYEVCAVAGSGVEAIQLADMLNPDLVLMDIVLKGDLDGIEAASEIKIRRQVPVIYVTAYTDDKTLERAKVTEPFAYIVKPFSERELRANIEIALYRHRMETRLRRVEQWFADSIAEPADAVIATDNDGRITLMNRGAESITAWNRQQAVGRRLHEVLRLSHRSNGTPIAIDDVSEGPIVHLAESTVLINRDNVAVPIDTTSSCIRDERARPNGIVSVFRDQSGSRLGAIASMNEDVSLAVTQAITADGMVKLCLESIARNLNAELVRLWTVKASCNTLQHVCSSGLWESCQTSDSLIAVGETPIGRIAERRRADHIHHPMLDSEFHAIYGLVGGNFNDFAGIPLVVEGRLLGMLAIFTQREIADSLFDGLVSIAHTIAVGMERKRLEEELRRSQKIEAIGKLAGGVAHDFNNLIMIITGCCDVLLGSEGLSPDQIELIATISKSGTRAASLTKQLLAFSRKQVVEYKILNLNTLIQDLDDLLRRLVGEHITLVTKLEPALDKILADAGQLEQIVMNLVVNARDAMPKGGTIVLETANVNIGSAIVPMMDLKPGSYVILEVRDTGCGMTQEVMEHVFEPYYSTKSPGEGTGLGLSTVYGIVKQCNGHIQTQSEVGIGTVFTIYLPAAGTAAESAIRTPKRTRMAVGTETVLLVEDESTVLALTQRILETCGYTVLKARNGTEAVKVAADFQGHIHLVLTDVIMPELNGREMVEILMESRPDTKVLYMSGYTNDAVLLRGISTAEADFIQKPFSPQVLASKVRELLDRV
ncbi:MAG: hypothetical protein AMXMBFR84_15540 [Candidatus Hydrogenedentota bacterium]